MWVIGPRQAVSAHLTGSLVPPSTLLPYLLIYSLTLALLHPLKTKENLRELSQS